MRERNCRGMFSCRHAQAVIGNRMALRGVLILLILVGAISCARADDVLFIGNSFTFGASKHVVVENGGVPKLVAEIAAAMGKSVATKTLAKSGEDWEFHLAETETDAALNSKTWNWVVLQDLSTRPTHLGDVTAFMSDGATFSDRIAVHSPHAGILLYETWARPAGNFYSIKAGHNLAGPEQMMAELHENYGKLRDALAKRNPKSEVRVALVGTAFARATAEYPEINVNAADLHHASPEGYYLAALVIYETIYHKSVIGAPASFFHGQLIFPKDAAEKLQKVADEVSL